MWNHGCLLVCARLPTIILASARTSKQVLRDDCKPMAHCAQRSEPSSHHLIALTSYASLHFAMAVDWTDNELNVLEIIHRYVQTLDDYFGTVCELDVIYNFDKAYWILDEMIIGGELQESSKKAIISKS